MMIATAFDFMNHMRDPEFRAELRRRGWRPDMDVVATRDDELAVSVQARMMANQSSSPCLIAWTSPTDDTQMNFMFAVSHPARRPRTRFRRVVRSNEISPRSTIGMIHDSMQDCGDFIPPDWGAAIQFTCDVPG